ncbi:MAG: tetratricopeptide repeat protein [Desulfobacterales bacterium]|nr:MAG: tetratricopeptide repeat protein [Desulfobacterales bacterium]
MNISAAEHKTDIAATLRKAVHHHTAGRWEEAARIYGQILEIAPDHSDALHLLGVIQHRRGDHAAAQDLIRQAIRNDPAVPIYHVSLGDLFQSSGDFTDAIRCYHRALRLAPHSLEALCNLGNALREQGHPRQAIACYRKCLTLNPCLAEVYNNLGMALHTLRDYERASANFKEAVRLRPDFADAYNNLGTVCRDQSNLDEALRHYQQALALSPENASINHNLGIIYQLRQDFDRARACYQKAIGSQAGLAETHNNLGKLYHDRNQFAQALCHYEKAVQIAPGHADAHFNRALTLLLTGRFKEGWQEYEWRFQRAGWKKIYPHRLQKPRWDGGKFSGRKLFVHSEQGFGDTIQFVRYLPRVKSLGGHVTLEVRHELYDLLQGFPGVDKLVPMSFDTLPREAYDCYIPLMSLPGIFGTDIETIPAPVPYIHALPAKIDFWRRRMGGAGLKIGVVWAAKDTYAHNKTCPPKELGPLFRIRRVEFCGLQKGSAAGQIKKSAVEVQNLGEEFATFADTAAAIECLDLVVSVDTAVAHLAGAMGKPVWILLPHSPDWRWLVDREDSPWYPTMRLFRQPRPGDWQAVVRTVKAQLRRLRAAKHEA